MTNMARFLFMINQIPIKEILNYDIPEIFYPVLVAFRRMCLYIRLNSNLDPRSCLWTPATRTTKDRFPVIPVPH